MDINLSRVKVIKVTVPYERPYPRDPTKPALGNLIPGGPEVGVKPLLQLAAEKAIEAFQGLNDYNKVLNFLRRMESMQKDFLFLTLLADHYRLLITQQKYRAFLRLCPPADQDLYDAERCNQDHHNHICIELDDLAGGDLVDGVHRSPDTEYFRERWEYNPKAGRLPKIHDSFVEWTTRELVSPSREERRLELGSHKTYYELRNGSIAVRHGPPLAIPYTSVFSQFISSQLLLYRLTCLFGVPCAQRAPLQGLWSATLVYRNRKNFLTFGEDASGEPYIRFYGSEEASAEALVLINHLVGNLITNEYARTLCGGVSQNPRWMREILSDQQRALVFPTYGSRDPDQA